MSTLNTSRLTQVLLLITALLLLSFTTQNLKKRITDTEFRYEFYTTQKEISAKSDRLYYWFKGGAIHTSEYGVSGELLDGEFEKFYLNNQLAEKGYFKNGLKDGLWKTWHKNGKIATKVYSNSGQKSGIFYGYSSSGKNHAPTGK
jgi:antitoxin component YwqK of YwqJK toxin-antitoxin module